VFICCKFITRDRLCRCCRRRCRRRCRRHVASLSRNTLERISAPYKYLQAFRRATKPLRLVAVVSSAGNHAKPPLKFDQIILFALRLERSNSSSTTGVFSPLKRQPQIYRRMSTSMRGHKFPTNQHHFIRTSSI